MTEKLQISLTKEAMERLIGDNPELEVALQKSALNWLRNHKLKAILTEEVQEQIALFKQDIDKKIRETTNALGLTEGWYLTRAKLSPTVITAIQKAVTLETNNLIYSRVQKEREALDIKINAEIEKLNSLLVERVDSILTPEFLKALVSEIVEARLSKK